jgi:hypothetical protein
VDLAVILESLTFNQERGRDAIQQLLPENTRLLIRVPALARQVSRSPLDRTQAIVCPSSCPGVDPLQMGEAATGGVGTGLIFLAHGPRTPRSFLHSTYRSVRCFLVRGLADSQRVRELANTWKTRVHPQAHGPPPHLSKQPKTATSKVPTQGTSQGGHDKATLFPFPYIYPPSGLVRVHLEGFAFHNTAPVQHHQAVLGQVTALLSREYHFIVCPQRSSTSQVDNRPPPSPDSLPESPHHEIRTPRGCSVMATPQLH